MTDHLPQCDLVVKPNTGMIRGWLCTCKKISKNFCTNPNCAGYKTKLISTEWEGHNA